MTPCMILVNLFSLSKYSTKPSQFSFFVSQMENYVPRMAPHQLLMPMKFDEFSTSTPQRCLAKLPLKQESIRSFSNWDTSLSFLRTTETAVYESHMATRNIRLSVELTAAEEAMLNDTNSNRKPSVLRSGKKSSSVRRRRSSWIAANYKRSKTSNKYEMNRRREKRMEALCAFRQETIDEFTQSSIEQPVIMNNATFSIGGATVDQSSLIDDESYMQRCEVDAFQNEVASLKMNRSVSLDEIDDDLPMNDDGFEQFCVTKASEHPYDGVDSRIITLELHSTANESEDKVLDNQNNNTMPYSMNSTQNTNASTATAKSTSHCTNTMHLQPHKIPQIVRHKSQARISFNNEKDFGILNQAIDAFNDSHPIVKYYLIAITVAFVSFIMLYLAKL